MRAAEVVTASHVMVGLEGRADRPRILEALERLVDIGAMAELPRPGQRNAARYFERAEDPYWALVEAHLVRREAAPSEGARGGRPHGP